MTKTQQLRSARNSVKPLPLSVGYNITDLGVRELVKLVVKEGEPEALMKAVADRFNVTPVYAREFLATVNLLGLIEWNGAKWLVVPQATSSEEAKPTLRLLEEVLDHIDMHGMGPEARLLWISLTEQLSGLLQEDPK